ncbi:MAG: glycosyltransferase [Candidatus Hydrogenedentes bacterium]|nr:glycosyltransferase [Candidatus Hydrogenedentota bacterium]
MDKRIDISPRLRAMLDYPKFVGPTRLLVLETEYFFDKSWLRAAESLGWETASVSSAMTGGLTRDQVAAMFRTVADFKPHFILTSNYAGMDEGGLFARFFEDARVPYVTWFTDTPRMILYNRVVHCSHYSVAATWERGYMPHLVALGFEHVYFMPHATDPHLFHGAARDTHVRDLAFVGASMISHAEEAWEKLREFPAIAQAVRDALDSGRMTRAQFAKGVETIVEPWLLDQCAPRERRHLELCLVYEGTRRIRADLIKRLAPLDIEVYGDPEWKQIHDRCFGDVGYFDALAPFYQSTQININSTSIQMATSVNQRVFDCPAAGGFLITDAQADLAELFDLDREAVTYRTHDELVELAARYRTDAHARARIIAQAQARIAAHHTHAHRLKALEGYLRDRFA